MFWYATLLLSCDALRRPSFFVLHKVGSVDLFRQLKFENKSEIATRNINFDSIFGFSICIAIERNNSYYFSRANQQKASTKIYSLTQCSLTVNECDWYILAGNDERINSHCLPHGSVENYFKFFSIEVAQKSNFMSYEKNQFSVMFSNDTKGHCSVCGILRLELSVP